MPSVWFWGCGFVLHLWWILGQQDTPHSTFFVIGVGQVVWFYHYLSGPVLRDTARLSQRYPPIARYGVVGVSTWPIGCDTPSPVSERSPPPGEHAKWRCDTPPSKGYLSDTCAIPYENKANGCDTPLCDTISKGYCAIWGGISHWAAKTTTCLVISLRAIGSSTAFATCLGIFSPPWFLLGTTMFLCFLQGCGQWRLGVVVCFFFVSS